MHLLRDTSINYKILVPPIVMVVALGVVLIFSIHGLNKQQSVLSRANELSLQKMTLVNEFIALSERVQSDLFRISVLRYMKLSEQETAPIHGHLEQGLNDLRVIYGQILSKWRLDQKEKEILKQMSVPMESFRQKTMQATAAVLKNPSFGILLVRSASVPFVDFKNLLTGFLNYQKEKIAHAENVSRETMETVRTTIIVIGVLTAFIAILGTIWIGRRFISRPVGSITAAMGQLAEGNLSIAVGDLDRQDEIGSMARAVEVFRKNAVEKLGAEKALRESEKKAQQYLEMAGVLFVALDDEGNIALINRRGLEILGYHREELLGKNWFRTCLPDRFQKDVLDVYRQLIRGEVEPVEYYENPILTKDGKERIIAWHNSVLQNPEGEIAGILSSGEDITERVQAEEEKKELEAKLQRAEKMEAMGLMAGGVAHDLNNILSGIVSYPELLLVDLPEDSPLRNPIKTIQESGMRAADVVEDLLTIARGVTTSKEVLNLNAMIEEYMDSAEQQKLEKIKPLSTYRTELDSELLNITCSASHVKKILMNLTVNASEAIEGTGTVTISTMNRYLDEPLKGYEDVRAGEYVLLSILDDGSGISPQDLDKIFEPFYTKKVMGRSGTGLGLAVVWNSMQDHKGYINVKTSEKGTVFELYFPTTREASGCGGGRSSPG